jgi:hypothetical protein
MAIKVSTLLAHNTDVILDTTPTLGGALNTNNFPIANGLNPVVISGNGYPTITGTAGQVLTTNGAGITTWTSPASGSITLVGDVTGSGNSPVTTTIAPTGVIAGPYGSSSVVGTFTVNSKGQLTAAGNSPISITPSAAGLGNVTNSLQVINAGGSPSIRQGTGAPSGPDTLGAMYVDRSVTNGDGIFYYDGAAWQVIAQKLNLYDEKTNGFIAPVAQALDSIALGSGAETATTATGSLAIGLQSLGRLPGGVVQASGRFASNGDAQAGRYMLRTNTISNTPTEMFINGTAGLSRLTLPDDATWTFRITVTGHRTDLGNGHAGYTAAGVIYRGAGASSTAIQGSVQKVVLAESNPSWDINISADNINGSLKVTVTGENSKTIRWVALIETVEITN